MKSVFDQLSDISFELEKSGANVTELDKLIDGIHEYEKTEKGYRCQLKDRGICLAMIGEDNGCYDNFEDCLVKKAGLYWCGEIGELVDREECEDCNRNQDCGCCECVQNGSAPFNCGVCRNIQIEIENVGRYCVTPDTSKEEIERIKKEVTEDPERFFSC